MMPHEIIVPVLGESVVDATVGRWLKTVGSSVAVDEPIVELETDKVSLEVNAPVAGILSEIVAVEGDNVEINAILGRISSEGTAAAADATAREKDAPPAATEQSSEKDAQRGDGPAVQKLIAERQLDPSTISASGKQGRLTKGDVLVHLEGVQPAATTATRDPTADARDATSDTGKASADTRVKMTKLRTRIMERLKEAQNTAAILTTFNEVDMSHVMALRSKYKDAFEKKYQVRLGFMSFFVKACVIGLKEIPVINAQIEGTDILYKSRYNIGVAVGTPKGLVVPTVKDADQLSMADIEKKIAELGKKAVDGKLTLEDLSDSTFTISNGGIYGSLMSTPILNPPQSAILGMHKIMQRPVVIDNKIEARPMMYLALSYDHRLIDGREAVTYLVRVKESIEDPERLVLEI